MIDSGVSSTSLQYFQNDVERVDFTRDNSTEDFIDHGTATLSVRPSAASDVDLGEHQSAMPWNPPRILIDDAQSGGSRREYASLLLLS